MHAFLHSDKMYVAAFIFLIIVWVAPTVIAVIRGTGLEPLMNVILLSVIPLGLPGAYIMACFAPGRVRDEPVRLPRVPGYPPDPRYQPGSPLARYPLEPDPSFLRDPRYRWDSPAARWPLP